MKFPRLWLRAETKPGESRTPLTPQDVGKLIAAGVRVWVEKSSTRIFTDAEYAAAGAQCVNSHSWRDQKDALILGLKELPEGNHPLPETHAYFAHAFRGQAGATQTLSRFRNGQGTLFDLEFLTDARGVRIAAFGFRAGYVGAALGFLFTVNPQSRPLAPFPSETSLWKECLRLYLRAPRPFKALITGAQGRCGSGARQFFRDFSQFCALENVALPLSVTEWDIAETAAAKPEDYLGHDIWIHAIGGQKSGPVFLRAHHYLNAPPPRLQTLVDVTCDLGTPFHRVPIIESLTTLHDPVTPLNHPAGISLARIAIDHLPTLLPRESSEEFSSQLLPYLLPHPSADFPWINANEKFREVLAHA